MTDFAAFLSHSSSDAVTVEKIAGRLLDAGIRPWFDRWDMVPGDDAQEALEAALTACPVCVVLVGPGGLGPWHTAEMRVAISNRINSPGKYRLVCVLLPGASWSTELPAFLGSGSRVEFVDSIDDEDGFHRLCCGIRGQAPGPPSRLRMPSGGVDGTAEETGSLPEGGSKAVRHPAGEPSCDQETLGSADAETEMNDTPKVAIDSMPEDTAGGDVRSPKERGRKEAATWNSWDHCYVVFFRLCDLDSERLRQNSLVAGAFQILEECVEAVVATHAESWSQSSVYGRFAVFSGDVAAALNAAADVLGAAVSRGVELSVGVACGRIEVRRDIDGPNWAGSAINLAARLASVPAAKPQRRILVEHEVAGDAVTAGSFSFKPPLTKPESLAQVKRTALRFRRQSNLGTFKREHEIEALRVDGHATVCSVVFDIVRYSELPLHEQVKVAEDLDREVRRALEDCNIQNRGEDFWYSPAGDGGVVCLKSTRNTWAFARSLQSNVAGKVPIRIGIGIAPIVVMPDGLPVGRGVLLADAISALPPDNSICCSQRFWNQIEEAGASAGFRSEAIEDGGMDAVHVTSKASSGIESVDDGALVELCKDEIETILRDFPEVSAVDQLARRMKLKGVDGLRAQARSIAERLARDTGGSLDEELAAVFGLRQDWQKAGKEALVEAATDVINWALPIRFDRATVDRIRREAVGSGPLVVKGTATLHGIEICMARKDGYKARIGDEPRFEMNASPLCLPEADVITALKDIAARLDLTSTPVEDDVDAYAESIEAVLEARRLAEGRLHYCVLMFDAHEHSPDSNRGAQAVLKRVRDKVPSLIFIRIDENPPTKVRALENAYGDRFKRWPKVVETA